MTYPFARPHDPIEEIAPDVFMVRGSVRLNALMSITRNMAILRQNGELTLVNPIRLDAAGERQLRALGRVVRILRLGPMHGMDDPYYVDAFQAELWAPGQSEAYPKPKVDRVLTPGTELGLADAELFTFQGTVQPESTLLVKRGKGLLLACDGVQHYGDYRHCSLVARLAMPLIGFPKTTVVGPFWLKMMTPEGGNLESEFRRLLGLQFDALLSAHGSHLREGAHESLTQAVDRAFKKG